MSSETCVAKEVVQLYPSHDRLVKKDSHKMSYSFPGAHPCIAVVSLNYVFSQLRSFRQRLVRQRLWSISEGPKSLRQRPTGQFANISISSTNEKKSCLLMFGMQS